jgi:hypothetical protein
MLVILNLGKDEIELLTYDKDILILSHAIAKINSYLKLKLFTFNYYLINIKTVFY